MIARIWTFVAICLALGVFALFSVGCAGGPPPEPRIETVEVKVPTPVPCVSDKTPRAPTYPDTDEALRSAPNFAVRYGLIAQGRELRNQRLAEIEPVIAACREPGGQ